MSPSDASCKTATRPLTLREDQTAGNILRAREMAQAALRKEALLEGFGHFDQPRAMLPESVRQEENDDRKDQRYHSRHKGPGKEEST